MLLKTVKGNTTYIEGGRIFLVEDHGKRIDKHILPLIKFVRLQLI